MDLDELMDKVMTVCCVTTLVEILRMKYRFDSLLSVQRKINYVSR